MKSCHFQGVPKEMAETVMDASSKFDEFFNPESENDMDEMAKPFYKVIANDVARQKKRLGGTFAVAHAVATRKSRDYLRQLMGPDLVFVVLNLTRKCAGARLKGRHGDSVGDGLENIHSIYQPAAEDEINAYNVDVEEGMTKDDVMQKVLEITERL